MSPAVVTAVLLLVGILNTVTARPNSDVTQCDTKYKERPCGDGWSRINPHHCAKYFQSKKNFKHALEHCQSLNSELVSIHDKTDNMKVACITLRANSKKPSWIGAQRSQAGFTYTDGSKFGYSSWADSQPDNRKGAQDCIEVNRGGLGLWNDANCSKQNTFVCSKRM